jgi:hypothetical protein
MNIKLLNTVDFKKISNVALIQQWHRCLEMVGNEEWVIFLEMMMCCKTMLLLIL